MDRKEVREIVAGYLKAHGYEGLAGDECGCGIEDLMPCGECYYECRAAYLWPREGCPRAAEDAEDPCEYAGECEPGCWRTERPPAREAV